MDTVAATGAEAAPHAWMDGLASAEFKALIDAKQRSIIPMMLICVVGYLGLSILAGFGRGLLGIKVFGPINLGFVLVAGNYAMSWLLGILYAWISSNRHDPLVRLVVDRAVKARRPR